MQAWDATLAGDEQRLLIMFFSRTLPNAVATLRDELTLSHFLHLLKHDTEMHTHELDVHVLPPRAETDEPLCYMVFELRQDPRCKCESKHISILGIVCDLQQ
jgi:hypothetical protein